MNESFSLGRIAGIRIGFNWSWFVVFGLVVWMLAVNVFPAREPGLSGEIYVVMAAAGAVLFFASLLAHELAHALQARREGMEIEGITLWLLGGVAKFRGVWPTAGAEFRIAIAGPAVSFILGAAFLLAALFMPLPDAVAIVAGWLGFINLLLLVFNLLPALPLDGGRVFRSALWHFKGDFGWSTRISARIGQGFGYLLIAAGIYLLIGQGSFSGFWFAIVGWFLVGSAGAEERFSAARQALDGLLVGDVMVREPVSVSPSSTLQEFFMDVVRGRRFTAYPVVDDGKAVGVLTSSGAEAVPAPAWTTQTVGELALPLERLPTFTRDEDLASGLVKLIQNGVGRGLVLEDGRLVGLLSLTDVLRLLDLRGAAKSTSWLREST